MTVLQCKCFLKGSANELCQPKLGGGECIPDLGEPQLTLVKSH